MWTQASFFIIVITLTLYFTFDGKALGMSVFIAGVTAKRQSAIMQHVLPAWDANQTWLVYSLAALYGAYSKWFAWFFTAYGNLFIVLLILFILRGAAIEFSHKQPRHRFFWYGLFSFVSALLLLSQGLFVMLIITQCQWPVLTQQTALLKGLYQTGIVITYVIINMIEGYMVLYPQKKSVFRHYSLSLMALLFSVFVLLYDILSHITHSLTWKLHLVLVVVLFVLAECLLIVNEQKAVSRFHRSLIIVTVLLCLGYQYPYVFKPETSLFTQASSPASVMIIAIASCIFLPIIFYLLKKVERIFQA